MAPELTLKSPYFGKKVDVWAMGIILFVMVMGYFPFRGRNTDELSRNIRLGVLSLPKFLSG